MTRILRSMASRSCKAGLSEFSRIMTSKSLNVWVNNRETDCLARAGLFRVGITTENLGFMALLSNLDFKVCSNCEPKPNVHPATVTLDRSVKKPFDISECNNLVKFFENFSARHP